MEYRGFGSAWTVTTFTDTNKHGDQKTPQTTLTRLLPHIHPYSSIIVGTLPLLFFTLKPSCEVVTTSQNVLTF